MALFCISIVVVLVSLGVVSWTFLDGRQAVRRQAEQQAGNIAVLLGRDIGRVIGALDLSLRGAVRGMEMPGLASLDPNARQAILFDASLASKGLGSVFIVDEAGNVVYDSLNAVPRPLSVYDRPYFQAHRNHPDLGLTISDPLRSRISGEWNLVLARRINHPDGSFAGIVLGNIFVSFFQSLFDTADTGNHGAISLVNTDGTLITRQPFAEQVIGRDLRSDPNFERLIRRPSGRFESTSVVDGITRLYHHQQIEGLPLVVLVGLSTKQIFADWTRKTAIVGGILMLLSLLGLGLVCLLVVQFRAIGRQHRGLLMAAEALTASQARAQENARYFETTLAHMDEGLMLVDESGRVVVCSNRASELLGLPPALMAARPQYEEVGEYQRSNNEFSRTDNALATAIAGGWRDAPRIYERERPDGQVLEVRSTLLESGGLVRTITDITARRVAEALVRHQARHDELTGLANRMTFRNHLEQALDLSARSGRGIAVLYLDLDRFKSVNDTRGHAVGDKLLVAVAERIKAQARASDIVARIGGDEFAIIANLVDEPCEVGPFAERLVRAVSRPYEIEGETSVIGVSIGIALYPADADTMAGILRCADKALYAVKNGGRSTFRFYSSRDMARVAAVGQSR